MRITVMPSLAATAWNDCVLSSASEIVVPGAFGVDRVFQQDGNPVVLTGLDRGRVQNFRPEIGQFGCLAETHRANGVGVVDKTRVVIMHAVDVGPNLHLSCIDGSAHQGCTVIAAAASEVVDLAAIIRADKSLRDVKFFLVGRQCGQSFVQ